MEVINESIEIENKDMLPHILMRIFSVCKADPEFPLKEKINSADGEAGALILKIKKQKNLLIETNKLRDTLSERLQNRRQENFEVKSRLLEELGSD